MKELHLEIFSTINDEGVCVAPVETAISLFLYRYCNNPPILLTFVTTSNYEGRACFNLKVSKLLFDNINEGELEDVVDLCKLPVILTHDGTTVVAGLCAVLRQMIKTLDMQDPLLGFKQSSLYACAETSVWTKFCEVDIINTINALYVKDNWGCDKVEIPVDVARFEVHMGQPLKKHNIHKAKQDMIRSVGLLHNCETGHRFLDEEMKLEHSYSEGMEMTLADIILYPSFYIILGYLGSVFLKQHIPLTYKWYERMSRDKNVVESLKVFKEIRKEFENEIYVNYILPNVGNHSLYRKEIKKNDPNKRRLYTRQEDITRCFEIAEDMGIPMLMSLKTFGSEVDFDWTAFAINFNLNATQIPEKRLDRKSHQLKNLTRAVLKIAKNGDRIVDFCSGSGHLGLILAHSLPRCNIILLENKQQSLARARERAKHLKLTNILFCQSNVDYFQGDFQIGVSLHACGVATDLVLERCIQERAAFVCCPCCYGCIHSNHVISYPRSEFFKNSRLTLHDYFVLAHSADQTHNSSHEKTSQGNKCMFMIDSDRLLRAKEAGYSVYLSKLDPPSCTPKNNLLVGRPQF